MKTTKNTPYPRIDQLRIRLYVEPGCCYVDTDEIAFKLTFLLEDEKAPDTFSKLFGVQACPLIPGVSAVYAWDAEAVLERMLSGKLTGTQLTWD
jgi:hypothetical protein